MPTKRSLNNHKQKEHLHDNEKKRRKEHTHQITIIPQYFGTIIIYGLSKCTHDQRMSQQYYENTMSQQAAQIISAQDNGNDSLDER
jgi:hypothetical protein